MVESSSLRNGSNITQDYFRQTKCANPDRLQSRFIAELNVTDFTCDEFEDIHQTGSRLKMGFIVASIMLVCLIAALVCFTYRRRVLLKFRGYFQYKRYKDDALYTVNNDQVEIDDQLWA
jgi:hypothetical protein